MTQTFLARSALLLTAAAALSTSLPAMARGDDRGYQTQEAVRFNPADLATPAGVASLRGKITRAAREACPMGTSNVEQQHGKVCFDRAVADGNARIDAMLAQRQSADATAIAASEPGDTRPGR